MFASGAYLLVCDFPTDRANQNAGAIVSIAVTGTAKQPKIRRDVLHGK